MNQYLTTFIGETLGTAFLILLGNGVVSNVVYKRTKASNAGPFFISVGWALAVFLGIIIANCWETGGHLNPAFTIALLTQGKLSFALFCTYVGSQLLGALVGQLIISAIYWYHANEDDNLKNVIHAHCTSPTHPKRYIFNISTEVIATSVLVGFALTIMLSFRASGNPAMSQMQFWVGPFTISLVVLSIGLSLGGVTGYAINPVRDLVPRIVYTLSPYKTKTSANWSYSWIPILGPLVAGVICGAFARLIA